MKNDHGINIHQLSNNIKIKKENIIDFSSNISSFGLSTKALEYLRCNLDLVKVYPDSDYIKLKNSIADYCNCNVDNIVLGSGATELISSYIKIIAPKKTLLLSPAYSEYEKELKKLDSKIVKFFYKKENEFEININEIISLIKNSDFDLIIICNPNNPTGTLISVEDLEKLYLNFKKPIMIDETYIEFTDINKTSANKLAIKYNDFIVIRSTSKFFSTPGIRLGYAIVSNGNVLNVMKSTPNLWNINIFACLMGEIMFRDLEFISNTRKIFQNNYKLLYDGLKNFNQFKLYKSSSNFILCEILNDKYDANILYDALLKKGIVIRKASSFDGLNNNFFRVCVLNKKYIEILLNEITNFVNQL